ncbi:MAG: isoprenylcysteine carboxylmethyltransferase family protein [Clostridia bacterium]|nr:isoprenylcysteine carboxylmethyltransferase family protein [Clostridia bacterium]
MTKKLLVTALTRCTLGIILVFLLIFLPAGTLHFPKGWLLMGVLFLPMLIAGFVMMIKNPSLLEKRLKADEKQKEQKAVIGISALMFVLGFVVAGLDFRFGWLRLPNIVTVIATAVFLLAYLLYARVLRENTYLSRTVEIQENQKVIDTGLYAIVRHPMYLSSILLFLSMPLILGSLYSFAVFLVYPFVIAKRIKYEERLLEKELSGYKEYKQKVKYRLLPFVW